jgi:hypothetical protein
MANLPNIPNLHDGCFDGLWLSGNRENTGACLFVRAAAGERYTLMLTGIVRLNIQDVRQGNIIRDVLLIPPDTLTLEQVSHAYDLESERDEAIAHRRFEKAQQERLFAPEMSTSYGAYGTVLFRAATVVPGHILNHDLA